MKTLVALLVLLLPMSLALAKPIEFQQLNYEQKNALFQLKSDDESDASFMRSVDRVCGNQRSYSYKQCMNFILQGQAKAEKSSCYPCDVKGSSKHGECVGGVSNQGYCELCVSCW